MPEENIDEYGLPKRHEQDIEIFNQKYVINDCICIADQDRVDAVFWSIVESSLDASETGRELVGPGVPVRGVDVVLDYDEAERKSGEDGMDSNARLVIEQAIDDQL